MDFKTLLQQDFILLDGAMGTMLQQRGLPPGACPELTALENPQWLLDIHRSYLESGSQVVYANTFGASALKLERTGHTPEEVIQASVALARQAAAPFGALVGLDLGPLGQLLEPTGTLPFREAYSHFARQVGAGVQAGADLIAIETMTDLNEARAALLAAKENSSLPVLCTMSFDQSGRTFTGCSVSSMALTLEGLGADAIGFNCSLGPVQLRSLTEELLRWTTLPVILKPNAGLPDPGSSGYDISPQEFASAMAELARLGVRILGGCCGTTPRYIALLKNALEGVPRPSLRPCIPAAVCSAARTVLLDRPRVIGERINPTGKKLFQAALRRGDMDYILSQALQQVKAGAELLDVNVGLPDIDEEAMMTRAVIALSGITDAPLQLDSTKPQVLEAALRVYPGKAIINSVNGEEESLASVLPLAKKYGAAVVGLTLDRRGIPKTAGERLAIARRILERALALGIPARDIFIDCLTLTASAEQETAMETLNAVAAVKHELGLKTVLGVSNISFGLPAREPLNQAFLTLALGAGLDLPILNPNSAPMMAAFRAYRLLANQDPHGAEYIAAYGGESAPPPAPSANTAEPSLAAAIEGGLKEEAGAVAARMLEKTPPMTLVNEILIPALDRTGAAFEKGKIFLPQLIQSAGAAQAAFEQVRRKLAESGQAGEGHGPVVIATVKGDIHDIGKNIVKVLLENYGFEVIDLGRDVDPQAVADAVRKYHAPVVGLSALMTTTLGSMADTIALLHREKLSCRVMVGGAVLTGDYAASIGADRYVRDAKESVDAAREWLDI